MSSSADDLAKVPNSDLAATALSEINRELMRQNELDLAQGNTTSKDLVCSPRQYSYRRLTSGLP